MASVNMRDYAVNSRCCGGDNEERPKIGRCGSTLRNLAFRHLPILRWAPNYSLENLQCDFIAGVTVGLMVIPQGLAYASIAKMQNQYGLYSAFMGCFVYCIFGTSKDVTLGPTAILSLMVSVYSEPDEPRLTVIMTLYVGMILLLMGLFRLSFIVKFISTPVISGFTTAAAVVIAAGQLKDILGLNDIPDNIVEGLIATFSKIGMSNKYDIIFGVTCIVILQLMKQLKRVEEWNTEESTRAERVARKLLWLLGTARNAVVVIVSLLVVYSLQVSGHGGYLTLTEDIDFNLPPFEPPEFNFQFDNHTITPIDVFNHLNVGVIIVPLIAFVESIAIAKAFSRKNKYKIDATQELIALGLANIFSSFVSSFPITGSFSRTAVNSQSGVRTPFGGVFTGVVVILAIRYLTMYFQYIPRACLGAVIMCAVLQMVDISLIRQLWKVNKLDLIPMFGTFLGSFYTIEFGLLSGVFLSFIFLLYPIIKPDIEERISDVTVIVVKNGLFFPGVESLLDELDTLLCSQHPPRMLVMDFAGVTHIDFTVISELHQIFEESLKAGTKIYILNPSCKIKEKLAAADLSNHIASGPADIPELEEIEAMISK